FFFQAEDGIRDGHVTGVQTCALPISTAFEHAQEFLQIVMPRYASRIKLYGDSEPMFHKYGIEDEISRIQRRHVPLPMGGSIVIEDRKSTRLNSSHVAISYAVFCLKKK